MGQDIFGIDPRSRVTAGQNLGQLGQGVGNMFMLKAQMEQQQRAAEAAARKERANRIREMSLQNLGVIRESMGRAAAAKMSSQELREKFEPAIRQYTEIYQAGDDEVESLFAKYFGPQQVNYMNPGQAQPLSLAPQQTAALPFTRPEGQGFGMGVPTMPLGGEQTPPEQQGFGLRPGVPPLGEPAVAGPGGFGIQTPDSPILGPGERISGSFTPSDMTSEAITVGAEAERTDKLNQQDVADLRALVPTMTAADQSRATAAISEYRRTGDISKVTEVLGSYQKSAGPLYEDFLTITGDIRSAVPLTQADLDKLDAIEASVSEASTPAQIRDARAKAQTIGNAGRQRDYLEKETIPDLESRLGELAQSTSDSPEATALRTFYREEWAKISDPNLTLTEKRQIVDRAWAAIRNTTPALARAAQTEARQNNYVAFLGNFGEVLSVEERGKAKDLIMAGDIAGATDLAMQAVTRQKDSASVSQAFDGFLKVYDKAIAADQDLATARNGILTEFDPVRREQKIRAFFELSAFKTMVATQVKKDQRAAALEDYSVSQNLSQIVAEAVQQGPEELTAALGKQLKDKVIDQETYDSELARLLPRAQEAQKYAELRKKGDFAGIVTAATEAGDADVVQMFGASAGLTPEQVTERISRAKIVREAGDKRRAFEMAKLDIDKGNLDFEQQNFLMSYAERLAQAGAKLPPELENSPLAKSAYENKVEEIRFDKQAAQFNYDQLVGGAAYDQYTQMLSGIPQDVGQQGTYKQEMVKQLVAAGKTEAVAEAIAQGDIEKFNRGMNIEELQTDALRRESEDAMVSTAQRDFAFAARTIPRKTEDQAAYAAKLSAILVKGGYSQEEADLAAKATIEDFNRGMNDREREIANQARLIKSQEWQQNYNKLNVVLDTIPDPGDAKAMQKFERDLAAAYRGLGYSQERAVQMAAGIASKARAQNRDDDADRALRNEAQEVGIQAARQSIAQNTRREAQDKFELAAKGIPPQTNPKSQTNYRDTTLVPQLKGMGYTQEQAMRIADGVIAAFNRGERDDDLTRRLREAQLAETEANTNRIRTANSPEADNPNGTPYQQATEQRRQYAEQRSNLSSQLTAIRNQMSTLNAAYSLSKVKMSGGMEMWENPQTGSLEILNPERKEAWGKYQAFQRQQEQIQAELAKYNRALGLLTSNVGTPLTNAELKELGLPVREITVPTGRNAQYVPQLTQQVGGRTALGQWLAATGVSAVTQQLGERANNQGNSNYGELGNIGLDGRGDAPGKPTQVSIPNIEGAKVVYSGPGSGIRAAVGKDGFGTIENWGNMLGNVVIVQLPSGHYQVVSHMSEIYVQPGQTLKPDQVLGVSGKTGNAQGVHMDIMFYRPNKTLINAGVGGANRNAAMNEIEAALAKNLQLGTPKPAAATQPKPQAAPGSPATGPGASQAQPKPQQSNQWAQRYAQAIVVDPNKPNDVERVGDFKSAYEAATSPDKTQRDYGIDTLVRLLKPANEQEELQIVAWLSSNTRAAPTPAAPTKPLFTPQQQQVWQSRFNNSADPGKSNVIGEARSGNEQAVNRLAQMLQVAPADLPAFRAWLGRK